MEPTQQHKYELWASNLLFVMTTIDILFLIVDYSTKLGMFDANRQGNPSLLLFSCIFTYVLMFALGYKVRKGRTWAKILLLVVVGGGIFMSIADTHNLAATLNTVSTRAHAVLSWLFVSPILVLLLLSFKKRPTAANEPGI